MPWKFNIRNNAAIKIKKTNKKELNLLIFPSFPDFLRKNFEGKLSECCHLLISQISGGNNERQSSPRREGNKSRHLCQGFLFFISFIVHQSSFGRSFVSRCRQYRI